MDPVQALRAMFHCHGADCYTGPHEEPVSALAHALQCARLAEAARASDALVTAAFLHDIGHFVAGRARRDADDRHEQFGADWLCTWFAPAVTQPIRLHVDAKRYLCATRESYRAALSPASEHSLILQGGPFTTTQAQAFIATDYARDAVRLRVWDDKAKEALPAVPDLRPGLEHFLAIAGRLIDPD